MFPIVDAPMISSMVMLNDELVMEVKLTISQTSPLVSGLQSHLKAPGLLMQVPPFLHGESMHSFMSLSQYNPDILKT